MKPHLSKPQRLRYLLLMVFNQKAADKILINIMYLPPP
jgi:hypothetical protein